MRKKSDSQSGIFNLRVAVAVVLCTIAGSLGWLSFAANPASGTISETNPVLTYDAGPFVGANATPVLFVNTGPVCDAAHPCDNYTLTVSLPAGYIGLHPNASVKVTMYWTDTGSGASDYDLYIYDGVVGNLSGSRAAPYQSAGGANPEVANITPLRDGTNQYSVKIVPYTPSAEIVHVRMELLAGTGEAGFPGFGGADPTSPGAPRYQNFYGPAGTSAEPGSGEANIGFNPATGRIMTDNSGPVWRLTPPEKLGKPECCEALWEDKSSTIADAGVDPILWTDQNSGRTFASNFTGGATAAYAYTDTDGEPTVTSPTGWTVLSPAIPNGGADHQTIGSGPYPASLAAVANGINKGHAVYYCSQDIVGPAFCQRSDDLGVTYGPGTLAYDGSQCQGLHGHLRVAPDGTAYLPVPDCNGKSGVAVSTDGGLNWVERYLPDSAGGGMGSDPSIAIDAANRIYFFNAVDPLNGNAEGHMQVQVSTDRGVTWGKKFDLGASHGIKNVAFPEAIGGDNGRAAVGFLGTDRAGNMESLSFPGFWYLFMATTYDGGDTWTVVNATPNDPVQGKGGIWHGGGSNQNRNLLDFNEVTMDDKGRVLFGYSDGCVGECVGNPDQNSFTAHMRVARQSGGKTLLASQDALTDTTAAVLPKAACLSGTRDQFATHLFWQAPDNGGSEITGYQILRGIAPGGETVLVNNTGTAKTAYNDTTADPAIRYYYTVKAINSVGTGPSSNEVSPAVVALPPPESACVAPGLTKLTDPSDDGVIAGSDLKSLQIAQPYYPDGVSRLTFTINTDQGQAVQPLGSAWYVSMKMVNGTATTYKAVRMVWNGATPTFESYTPSPSNSGAVDGRFVTSGSQKPAESGSYNAPYDKVVVTVKASDLGLAEGSVISGFVSGVAQPANPTGAGANAVALYDQMPNSLAYASGHTVDNQACRPNTAPTAVLTASPTSGFAPLTVGFDGSGSSDPDTAAPADTIASYRFDFGDGTSATQSTPTTTHNYPNPGTYSAALTVTDSRGAVSTNSAQQIITVNGQPDLSVSDLVASNSNPKVNEKVKFTATIINIGNTQAGASKTQFLLDGTTQIGLINTPLLAPGASAPVSVSWTAKAKRGTHTIKATADKTALVSESNETNNDKSIPISIR